MELANSITAADVKDWLAIATLVYDRTTKDISTHKELRNVVVQAAATRISDRKPFLQHEDTEVLIRSVPDLAADLLIASTRIMARESGEYVFMCEFCHFSHIGSRDCPMAMLGGPTQACPHCGHTEEGLAKKRFPKTQVVLGVPCHACHGSHSVQA